MDESPGWLVPRLRPRAAVRTAAELPLPPTHVEECLTEADKLFRRAWRHGLDTLTLAERRGRLAACTGCIAEAVATLLLSDIGLDVFAQITTPGIRGVDLMALTPEETVLAIEVKGTLRARAIPRFSRSSLGQMSVDWLNDPNNPAMVEWELEALDIYGALLVIDFARGSWRAALTSDFEGFRPVLSVEQLLAPSQLAVDVEARAARSGT